MCAVTSAAERHMVLYERHVPLTVAYLELGMLDAMENNVAPDRTAACLSQPASLDPIAHLLPPHLLWAVPLIGEIHLLPVDEQRMWIRRDQMRLRSVIADAENSNVYIRWAPASGSMQTMRDSTRRPPHAKPRPPEWSMVLQDRAMPLIVSYFALGVLDAIDHHSAPASVAIHNLGRPATHEDGSAILPPNVRSVLEAFDEIRCLPLVHQSAFIVESRVKLGQVIGQASHRDIEVRWIPPS